MRRKSQKKISTTKQGGIRGEWAAEPLQKLMRTNLTRRQQVKPHETALAFPARTFGLFLEKKKKIGKGGKKRV